MKLKKAFLSYSNAAVLACTLVTIKCGGGAGSASPAPTVPTITSFSVNPASISDGQTATLTWNIAGATSVSISPNIGNSTATSLTVSPFQTTTYTITALNTVGSSSSTVKLSVSEQLPNTWINSGSMVTGRSDYSANILNDGKILVSGGMGQGQNGLVFLSSAEIYDPVTRIWRSTGSLNIPRYTNATITLGDGRVMVFGGFVGPSAQNPTGLTETCEIWDPITEKWTFGKSMSFKRSRHTATTLKDGRIFICGGGATATMFNSTPCEIFDPKTNTWTIAAGMQDEKSNHTASLLLNGNVLVAGGLDKLSELYNPATDKWTSLDPMFKSRTYRATATLLTNGNVLIVSGESGSFYPATFEVFESNTNKWTSCSDLNFPRYAQTLVILQSGKVLITGNAGENINSEIFDPTNGKWTICSKPLLPFAAGTGLVLGDGRVLFIDGNYTGKTQIYKP